MSSQEDKQGKSDSSENQEENPVIESNKEAIEPPEMQNANDTVGCDENTGYNNNNKEEILTKINKREDELQKVCGKFYIIFCQMF